MKEEKKEELKNEQVEIKDKENKETPKLREIIIETDGNNISIKKAEVSGSIELTAILQSLINFINQPQK